MKDIDIRYALRDEMKRMHGKEPDTLVVEELGLCQGIARVDLAVVNGSVHGYEIKSEKDTLARLPAQTSVYSRALEFVTLIGATTHIEKISSQIPRWWGIWEAREGSGRVDLTVRRAAERNPGLDPYAIAQLLWRDEALQALGDHGLAEGMASKPRAQLWQRLASELTLADLTAVVREQLKNRGTTWRVVSPRV